MDNYCFGIDVGGTTIKCGLFRGDGMLFSQWEIPTRTENKGENIIPDIAETIGAKMKEHNLVKEQILGIGIDVPGPVVGNGEVLFAVNLFWGHKRLAEELEKLTGFPVKVGNDANVAALGEAWKGAAAGSQNIIMVTLGTGVGGGIIVNGHILQGSHGAAGEVGHANVHHHEVEKCNCGNRGCLEQYASATGIVRVAHKHLTASDDPSILRGIDPVTAKDVLDAYKAGDALAGKIMDEVGDLLGGALAVFASVTDPEMIVVGGGVSKAGQPIIDWIQRSYVKYAFQACRETPIVLASLGNDAGIYGSARMVLKELN